MSIRGKLLFPAAVLFLLLIRAGTTFASGQKEDPLSTAQQLINEKKYNDAIFVITQVMKEKPREFDRAQALLSKIDKARETYNAKVAELITVFNQGNLEKAYQIIKELAALDKAPNKRTLESQAYARQTATFVYDTKRFQALMDKALPFLKAADYGEAVKTYLSGFDIGTDLFDQANYGNIMAGKVNGLRQDMRNAVSDYLRELNLLDGRTKAIRQDLSRPTRISTELQAMIGTLGRIEAAKGRIQEDIASLKLQREVIVRQRNKEQDVPLIGYLDRIIHGRSNAAQPEGVLFAINGSWASSLDSVYAEIEKRVTAELTSAKRSYESRRWNRALGQFAGAKSYALLAAQAATAWGLQVSLEGSLSIPPTGWRIIDLKLPDVLNNQVIARAADGYTVLVTETRAIDEIASAANAAGDSIPELAKQRRKISKLSAAVRKIQTTWNGLKQRYTALDSQKIDLTQGLKEIDAVSSAVDVAVAEVDKTTIVIAAREGNLRLAPVADSLAEAKAAAQKAVQLIKGIPPKNTTGVLAADVKERYPDQAQRILGEVKTKLQGYRQSALSATGYLSGERPLVVDSPPVRQVISRGERLSSEISTLDSNITSLLAQAKRLVFEAARYRQEGENRLRLAQDDLARKDFASARQQIAAAAAGFDKSLSLQANPDVRRIRDEEIPRLSSRIIDSENVVVVRKVRAYINQGREFYQQGAYARAQDMFLRAESRWRRTNTVPNPEIMTWLQYVNTALSINSGRTVSPTDPLYSEIAQVLNLAQSDYEKGKQLIAQEKTARAQTLLSDAQTKLIYVQIPFPLNKDARVLSLKILRLTDPKNFMVTFRQKYEQAVAELKSNPQNAYIALKDLQAIEPSYRGLGRELYRAEILTGIRRPPPDPAKVAESSNLYQKAFDIVRQNVRAQYPIALSYLNKAIELDPNNRQAALLKDRISIDQGAATTVVLSSTAQIQFKLAQEQFIAKSYYEALRIVNQLLKVPMNRNYSPLLELKRRIESKI